MRTERPHLYIPTDFFGYPKGQLGCSHCYSNWLPREIRAIKDRRCPFCRSKWKNWRHREELIKRAED